MKKKKRFFFTANSYVQTHFHRKPFIPQCRADDSLTITYPIFYSTPSGHRSMTYFVPPLGYCIAQWIETVRIQLWKFITQYRQVVQNRALGMQIHVKCATGYSETCQRQFPNMFGVIQVVLGHSYHFCVKTEGVPGGRPLRWLAQLLLAAPGEHFKVQTRPF